MQGTPRWNDLGVHPGKWVAAACMAVALTLLLPGCVPEAHGRPYNLYLTYAGDPATSITVNFHTAWGDETYVYFDEESRGRDLGAYAYGAVGEVVRIPGLEENRAVHRAQLINLTPDTEYFFVAGDPATGFTDELRFRTLPRDGPVTFAAGGDLDVYPRTRRLLEVAAAQDPAFVAVGGDIAYANGDLRAWRTWDRWFRIWCESMRAPDGRIIPIVAAIGNHETNDRETTDLAVRAPYFAAFFAHQAEGRTHFTLPIAAHTVLYVLDSGHVTLHADQVAWLEAEMEAHAGRVNHLALYHVPLYPSHRSFDGSGSVAGRTHWGPVFDARGLDLGIENHDHTFKRSKPLKDGVEDPDGTVYIGDGSMGVKPRAIEEVRWYLEKALPTPHVWVLTADTSGLSLRALDERGAELDAFTLPAISVEVAAQ